MRLKKNRSRLIDTGYLGEFFIKINGVTLPLASSKLR